MFVYYPIQHTSLLKMALFPKVVLPPLTKIIPSVLTSTTPIAIPGYTSKRTISDRESKIYLPYSRYVPIRIDAQKEYNKCAAWGMLTSIDAHSCDPELIRSKIGLQNYVDQLCSQIQMEKYGKTRIVHFGTNEDVEGFSLAQFIQTSLVSGHFSNKTNSCYLDIFSCSPYDPKVAAAFTASFFSAKNYNYSVLLRGATRKL